MPKITFLHEHRAPITIEVPVGHSLMEAAVRQGIDGIVGECGGSASCATCHVYVEAGNLAALPPIGPVEAEMLDATASRRRPDSRLGCQIVMTSALDALIVRLPPTQI